MVASFLGGPLPVGWQLAFVAHLPLLPPVKPRATAQALQLLRRPPVRRLLVLLHLLLLLSTVPAQFHVELGVLGLPGSSQPTLRLLGLAARLIHHLLVVRPQRGELLRVGLAEQPEHLAVLTAQRSHFHAVGAGYDAEVCSDAVPLVRRTALTGQPVDTPRLGRVKAPVAVRGFFAILLLRFSVDAAPLVRGIGLTGQPVDTPRLGRVKA
mmetsp:Transcript_90384/g.206705  ORF Transcript_90384/g.206705 Transcript_90384/m.206705 type:complete len:210 (+) Transcript_90384:404-1033(+)